MSTAKKVTAMALLVCCAGAAGGVGTWKVMETQLGYKRVAETEAAAAMKIDTVKKGTVSVDITEDGTVTYGTVEQDLSMDTASTSSSSSSGSSSTDSSSGGMSGGMSGMPTGMSGGMTAASADMSGQSGSSSGSSSTASLIVDKVNVASGQKVQEGDVILTITEDSLAEYRESLEEAIASAKLTVQKEEINVETKQAEADYTYNMYLTEGKSAEETYNATITSLDKTISDLEDDIEEAQEDVDTYQEYVDAGKDYDDELEDAKKTLEDLEAQLTVAKNNKETKSIEAQETYEKAMTNYKYADQLYAIDTDGIDDDLKTAQDTLEDAEEALASFEEEVGDGQIVSDYTGTIDSVSYAAGDTLTNNSAVCTFSDADAVTITVSVTQDDINSISVGSTASIALDAYSNETFDGEVTEIASSTRMGSSTVNYDVTVLFTGDISKVYSGMSGEVSFSVQSEADTLYVPNKAIHQDGADVYVNVLQDDGSIVKTLVTTGFSNGSYVAIVDGLKEGQTVVTESKVNT